ncbi:MAG: arylsulfotransferase family protein [Gemmatimonadales bacterium]
MNSAAVDVDATGYDAVRLRMRTAGEPADTSPAYPVVNGHATASALGMLAEHDYAIDILMVAGTTVDSVDTVELSTGALPDWIPDVGGVGDPADGFIGLAHPAGGFVVDGQGRVRWYFTSVDPVLNNFMAHPSGDYTIFGTADGVRLYRVVNERGEVTDHIGCVGRDTRFHEIRVMRDGGYWAMCDHPIATDLSSRGGRADATVTWTTLQHVAADGTLLFEFDTSEHFSLDDIDPALIPGATNLNMTHGNAIAFDTDGGVLASWRSLDEITKIDPATGDVVWRLGGRANQFTIDDPTRAFARQHGLRVVGPGVIQFLDNGTGPPSRLVRYAIDEDAMTADLVFGYADASDAYTFVGGNTDVLPDGRSMVSFGQAGIVDQVDSSGNETFALTGLDGEYIFRAFRLPSLYASERRAE